MIVETYYHVWMMLHRQHSHLISYHPYRRLIRMIEGSSHLDHLARTPAA